MSESKPLTFGVCAPSSFIRLDRFEQGVEKLYQLGYPLVIHPQSYARLDNTQAAGTSFDKITALYDLLADQSVDAILIAGGGNLSLHLLDQIDYQKFKTHPKPIIGFSDATALLNAIAYRTGQMTCHGPMVTSFTPNFFRDNSFHQMIDLIRGTLVTIPLPGSQVRITSAKRSVTGRLWGGNLEVFRALIGTPYLPDLKGAILFFEDIGFELSHLDRTLCSLKLAGLFDHAAGLIFGQFTDPCDTGRPFGFDTDDIIRMHTGHLDIPVVTHAPFGHTEMPPAFPVGTLVTLDIDQGVIKLILAK